MNADCHVRSPPRDFPILRSSPIWQPTWVETVKSFHGPWQAAGSITTKRLPVRDGFWFPPLQCGPNGFGDRKKFIGPSGWRLYTTDNCPDCTAALQAVELMVYSVARFLADEPQQWEHRCYWRDGKDCTCGLPYSWLLVLRWRLDAEMNVVVWAWKNRCSNNDVLVRDGQIAMRVHGVPVFLDENAATTSAVMLGRLGRVFR
jgi:hypothetical protein